MFMRLLLYTCITGSICRKGVPYKQNNFYTNGVTITVRIRAIKCIALAVRPYRI